MLRASRAPSITQKLSSTLGHMKFVTISGSNQSSSRPPDAGHRGSAYKALVPPEPSYLVGRYGEIENEIDDLDNLCARKQRRRRWTVFTRPTPIFPKSGQSLDSLSSRSREKLPAPSTDATTFPPTRARGSLHAAPCMRLLLFASGMASVSALHDRDREGCGDHDQDHRRDAFNRVSKRALRSGRGTVACSALAVRLPCARLAFACTVSALSDIGIPAGRLVIDAAQVRKARVMHKKMQTSPQFCLQLGLQYRLGSI